MFFEKYLRFCLKKFEIFEKYARKKAKKKIKIWKNITAKKTTNNFLKSHAKNGKNAKKRDKILSFFVIFYENFKFLYIF